MNNAGSQSNQKFKINGKYIKLKPIDSYQFNNSNIGRSREKRDKSINQLLQ